MDRAYSLLTIKAIDLEAREFEGIASTPEVDRMGDVVVPEGAQFRLPLPLLWHHDKAQPIGEVFAATVTPAGITIRARVAQVDEPGTLRDRLEEAWQSLRAGLVKGLSIGFQPLEKAPIKGTLGVRFLKWVWIELSAVTIPANQAASITAIKAMCERPALRPEVRAGVAATATKARAMKTYREQIATFEASRAARAARQAELMDAAAAKGETLEAPAAEEYDGLAAEIKGIDQHLVRLREAEAANVAAAKAVAGATPEAAAAARAPEAGGVEFPVVRASRAAEPGIGFARVAICRAVSFLSSGSTSALEVARERFSDDPRIAIAVKAAVGAGTTLDPANAQPLAYFTDLASEFLEWLRPLTIVGRVPGLTMVPFNIRVGQQLSGGAAWWVGQAKPKPVTAFTFGQQTLGIAKLASISVLAEELVRFSNPRAEGVVRQSLAGAVQEQMDRDFIDPGNAGIVNVKPASITNSVAGIPSAGNNPDDVAKDLLALVKPITAAKLNPAQIVLIMSPAIAMTLGIMKNSLGQPEFPGMGPAGGTLLGFKVVTSELAAVGGLNGEIVVATHAPSVLLADDGQVTVDASREASLEMDSAPTQDGAAGTGASLVSLWQNNLLGLRAERVVNWGKTRPECTQWLKAVAWGS